MAEFNLGEAIPWEPIGRGANVPVRGSRLDYPNLIARRVEVGRGVDDDRELLEQLRELERQLGGSGRRGGGRPPATGIGHPDRDPTPPSDDFAWYITFRRLEDWGVYVSRKGRANLAHFLVLQGADAQQAHDASWYLLYNHEVCHFLVDRAVHTLESSVRVESGRFPDLWLHRARTVRDDDLEEAVCNAYAYRMAAMHRGAPLASIREFVKRQPRGYRDIDFDSSGRGRSASAVGMTRFQAESQLLTAYLARSVSTTQRVVGLDSLMGYRNRETGTDGDVILRVSDNLKRVLPVYRVP
jgi:hypothetical protein